MTMTEIEPVQGETLWREHQTYIEKVAKDIARSFWKVEAEDVEQEVWVFLWEKEQHFLSGEFGEAYVRVSIKNVAMNYALKQRNKTLLETDTFFYAADEVKDMLPTFFSSYEGWALSPVPPGYPTATKNDNVEVFCDFSIAWDRLNGTQQDVLLRKYSQDEDFSEAKDRQALSRATRRFVTLLNQGKDIEAKNHQGPGSRKAITNANAMSQVNRAVND